MIQDRYGNTIQLGDVVRYIAKNEHRPPFRLQLIEAESFGPESGRKYLAFQDIDNPKCGYTPVECWGKDDIELVKD